MNYHTKLDLEYTINQALPIIQAAGNRTLSYFEVYTFHQQDALVDYKSDNSPVTEADKSTELWMRKELKNLFPNYGIMGEEFGDDTKGTEFSWIIDPIDGTKSFITGVPLYTTLLALVHTESKTPIAGFIYAPVTKELIYAGTGLGTWYNGNKTQVNPCHDIANATLLSYDWCSMFKQAPALYELCLKARMVRTWADGFAYILLASGKAHGIVDTVHLWDILPVYPIIIESGGYVSSWNFSPLDWTKDVNNIIATSSEALLELIFDYV